MSFNPIQKVATVFALLILLNGGLNAQEEDRAKLDFFETKIRPVLIEYCYECHSAKSPELQAGLLVDSREAIREGGESGPGVVPHKPAESIILEALQYDSYEMPPEGKLPDSVIADFKKWIEDGAIDPRESASNSAVKTEIDLEKGKQFWSFRPVSNPTVPIIESKDWSHDSVDRFIKSALESKNIDPSPSATKTEWIRRVYFDLIGLPPTPDEIQQFVNDKRPDAREHLIDQLLDKTQFGERWARHWLDVARYSDSSGGGRVLIFHDAWRYRDYVIDSYNNDKPISEFIRQQLAGDLLPETDRETRSENVTATGFLMLGPHNYELQDKELLRMEIIDEQIDVMGRAFLGMTLGCVRCHDHKFDPIPVEDYYALAGIFRSTDSVVHANVSRFVETNLPLSPEQKDALSKYKQQLAEFQAELKQLESDHKTVRSQIAANSVNGRLIDDRDAKLTGKWNEGSLEPYVGEGYQYAPEGSNAIATFQVQGLEPGEYDLQVAYTAHPNRGSKVPVQVRQGKKEQRFVINQRKQPSIDGLFHSLGKIVVEANNEIQILLKTTKDGCTIIDAVHLVSLDSDERDTDNVDQELIDSLKLRETELAEQVELVKTKIQEHQKTKPADPDKVMSVRKHSEVGDYFVCIRGDAHKLGDQVKRQGLSVLPNSRFAIPDKASGRLELANWIVSDENPLTARVYVNRVWAHLFGYGLVRTPDNFGAMGEVPSHPELLDHLAAEFVKNGWSTKWLVRKLVLSQTYARSSTPTKKAIELDPENRLLSHAHRRRLDVESIRDSILVLSGEMDTRSFGPTITRDLKREFGYKYQTKRRTLYLPIFRNTLNDMLAVFDFPNPNLVSGQRNASTLPTQALFMMNSPFVIEQSKLAAARVMQQSESNQDRINWVFEQALGRQPNEVERRQLEEYLQESSEAGRDEAETWSEICQSLIACLDFRFVK